MLLALFIVFFKTMLIALLAFAQLKPIPESPSCFLVAFSNLQHQLLRRVFLVPNRLLVLVHLVHLLPQLHLLVCNLSCRCVFFYGLKNF